jgi:MYXO-CTERM domain-containing protein
MLVSALARTAAPLALLSLLVASPAAAEPREGKRLLALKKPCDDGQCLAGAPVPHAKGKRIIYLAFEGVTLTSSDRADDATTGKSVILYLGGRAPGQTLQIGAFNPSQLSNPGNFSSRQALIDAVVAQTRSIFEPYDVEFTLTRPSSGDYEMIVFGSSCQTVLGESGCGGVALADCGNSDKNNITFVFPPGLDYRDLAPTAAQESAHAFGLAHTTNQNDVMYPFIQPGIYPSAFGNTNSPCPSDEVAAGATCNKTSQNSHQTMLDTIGFPGQDVYGPDIVITSHVAGMTIRPGDKIRASIVDSQNAVQRAELLVNSASAEIKSSGPYEFTFPSGVTPGTVIVQIRASDSMNNQSIAGLQLYLPSGQETPCNDDDDCGGGGDLECNGEFCVPENGVNELGEPCADGAQCDTGLCGEVDGDNRCTRLCDSTQPCPDGFDCRGGGDGAPGACWPGGDSGGCGCRTAGVGSLPGLAILLGLAVLGLGRRRRS